MIHVLALVAGAVGLAWVIALVTSKWIPSSVARIVTNRAALTVVFALLVVGYIGK